MKMAEAMDYISCSICLDVLKDPVTIPCGHSYCLGCIKGCWDQDDQKGVYSCPQCRQTFVPKPALNRSTMLAELVEKLKKTGPQAAPPAHCYTGPGDVECDVCTGSKRKAIKSCLVCLASYCETHLKLHNDLHPGNKHRVVDATGQLQEKICSHHDKLLEVYCRTDQQCICYLCLMNEHKGHDTVSAAAERTEKQRQLGENQTQSQQKILEREKEVQEVKQAICSLKSSARAAVEDSDRTFTELIRSMETRRSEVRELINAREKAEVSRAEALLRRLEKDLAELRRRDAEMEQLSHTEDHIHFLQRFQSVPPGSEINITVRPQVSFEAVKTFISEMAERLQDLWKDEMTKATQMVSTVGSGLRLEPKTREEFLEYSCQLTLDPNTAHNDLYLSEGNRKVTRGGKTQSYADHPDRFTKLRQLLCREALSGVCYWEVDMSGKNNAEVAVSYKGIKRGDHGDFRHTDQSWCLTWSLSKCSFWHNKAEIVLPASSSSRLGVFLDHRAGTLCFYVVPDSGTMTLLHRVQTTFTQPLYPGFYLYPNSSLRILTPIQ